MKVNQRCAGTRTQCVTVVIVTPYGYFSLATGFFLETLKTCFKDIRNVRFLARSYPRVLTEVDISFVRDMLLIKPDIIGFSNFFWNLEQNIKLALLAKSLLSDIFVIFGGPQVGDTGHAVGLLEQHHCIDAILCGEADHTFPELVHQVFSGEKIGGLAGLVRRDNNGISVEEGTYYVQDINTLPIVFHSESEYADKYLNVNDLIPLQTLRGCRQTCSYCLYCTSPPRLFSLDRVEKEVGFLCERGARYVRVCDSYFGGSKKRAMEIFDIIRHHNTETIFSIYPDPRHIDMDYIRAAGNANCRIISLGVETLDPAVSSEVNRGSDDTKFLDALHLLNECGGTPQLDMMFGLPKQSERSFQRDLVHLKVEGAGNMLFSPLMVFPGTELDSTRDDKGMSIMDVPQRYGYDKTLGLDEYAAMIVTSVCYRLLCMFPRVDFYARSISSDKSKYKECLEKWFSEATAPRRADLLTLYDGLGACSEYIKANADSLADMAGKFFSQLLNNRHDKPEFLDEIARMDIMEIAMKQRRDELTRDIYPHPGSTCVISQDEFVKLRWVLNKDTWMETHNVPYELVSMGKGHSPGGHPDKVYCIYFCPTCTVYYVDDKEFEFLRRFTQAKSLFDSENVYSSKYMEQAGKWGRIGVIGIGSSSPQSGVV